MRRHRLGKELCFALFSFGTVISEPTVCSLSLGFGKGYVFRKNLVSTLGQGGKGYNEIATQLLLKGAMVHLLSEPGQVEPEAGLPLKSP